MEQIEVIDSGQPLCDFNHHIRVLAGPGAGKTYWLVEQIKYVLKNSDLLVPGTRIACISYTSVAAEEIRKRLGAAAARVEVSTIHSFLYRNVVSPYLYRLSTNSGESLVAVENVDGHTKHFATHGRTEAWIQSVSKMNLHRFKTERVFQYLESLRWIRDGKTGELTLRGDNKWWPGSYFPGSGSKLLKYKPLYWQDGIIDHEDVLYFSIRILEEAPNLLRFLSSRFPYLFLDEFQDTNPLQTEVVEALAKSGTFICTIGDVEQSIYGFAGATPEDFDKFQPEGQHSYRIETNRRSTRRIIRFLNHLRAGSGQKPHVEIEGDLVTVIVGPVYDAILFARDLIKDERLVVLTRRHSEVQQIRCLEPGHKEDVWGMMYAVERERPAWIRAIVEATVEANAERYPEAVRILYQGMRVRANRLDDKIFKYDGELSRLHRRRIAAGLLPFLVSGCHKHKEMSCLDFYNQLSVELGKLENGLSLKGFNKGKLSRLFEETPYERLLLASTPEGAEGDIRTIHSAKGEEFDNVLFFREDKKDGYRLLHHLLNLLKSSNTQTAEEKRTTYVGLSRARKRLFIVLSQLAPNEQVQLEELDLAVVHVGGMSQ